MATDANVKTRTNGAAAALAAPAAPAAPAQAAAMGPGRGWWIVRVGLLAAAAVALGLLMYVLARDHPALGPRSMYLSAIVVAVGLIALFGFLQGFKGGAEKLDEEGMRSALAAAMVTVYLVLVGLVAFFDPRPGGDEELPKITETMLTSFTALVAIVVPFYFGASAYVQAQGQKQGGAAATTQTAPADTAKKPAGG